MRINFVILFCLFIAVVNSATTKAPARKSAYAYLRSVRGKNSCASGSCPFWERHGRSFVSLRCFSQEYQDCVCLHRMCYSSCLFTRQVCNQEMVSCLQQICPRCLPASSLALCPASNLMAQSVTNALSTFACYSCCPVRGNSSNNAITIAPSAGNRVTRPGNTPVAVRPSNGASQNGNTGSVNGGNRPANGNTGSVNGANRPANGANRPANGNTGSVNGASRPVNGNAGSVNSGARPASGNAGSVNGANRPANGVNNGLKPPSNGNQGSINNNNGASVNQQIQKKASTTRRTTRRTATTKPKPANVRTTKCAQKQSQMKN
jgi:hypothetical protein